MKTVLFALALAVPIGALTLDYGRRAARRQLERLANPSDGFMDGMQGTGK